MRAVVFVEEGRVDVGDVPEPELNDHDNVLVRVDACGICGSDLRAVVVPPQMHYTPDTIIGHEFVGDVVDSKPNTGIDVGQRVVVLPNIPCRRCYYCRTGQTNLCENFVHIGCTRPGGAAEFCAVPADMVHMVPDGLSSEIAALTEPLACVLNGSLRAGWHPGTSAVVLGGGPIGLLYVLLAKAAGASPVIVSEPSPARAARALQLGADAVVDPSSADLAERVRELTGVGADIVVDAVGSLLPSALASVRKGGRVLVFGLDHSAEVTIHPAQIVDNEIEIKGIYITRETFPLALRLLAQRPEYFAPLITHRLPLEDFWDGIELMKDGTALKVLLEPRLTPTTNGAKAAVAN